MAGEKFLVVDDDAKISKIVYYCLNRKGITTIISTDKKDTILKIRETQPDLVVMNLTFPKNNDIDVCKTLSVEHDLPILILPTKGEAFERIIEFRIGVDDYLGKPFSPMELCKRVQAILGLVKKHEQTLNNPFVDCGALTIDCKNRIVNVNNKPMDLTVKEFELLFLMASNPRRIFTRMQLLKKIWNSNHLGDGHTVTVHIRRLRKKIAETDSSVPQFIKTVWGVGYKFSCE